MVALAGKEVYFGLTIPIRNAIGRLLLLLLLPPPIESVSSDNVDGGSEILSPSP
jgi:hypothetical protein